MSRNFLFALLSLTVAGLLWGAHGDSPDGVATDNNESSASKVVIDRGSSRGSVAPGVIRVPYLVLRRASSMSTMLLRALTWLPRRVALNVAQLLSRLMAAFKEYATDVLGYLASSERKELIRVRRGVPVVVAATRSKPTRPRIKLTSLIFNLFTYPLKAAFNTVHNLVRFSPAAGTLNLLSSLLSNSGVLFRNPLVAKAGNITRDMTDFAIAEAWNFTKSSILPRLDGFVNNLKDSGTAPESLMTFLIELQTLYHLFKFLGMA